MTTTKKMVRDPNEEVTTSNTVRNAQSTTTVTPLDTSVSNTSANQTNGGGTTTTAPQKPDSVYLNQQDQEKMNLLENNYNYYKGVGNREAADQAHAEAEKIRAGYGYSGGVDGAQLTTFDTNGVTKDQGYQASELRRAQLQDDYINSMYEAQQASALQALKSAYDQNVVSLDAQAEKIPATYQAARNKTAATADVNRVNFNEYAAASGLNTGAGGQAQLAMSNQYLGDINAINQAEAEALNDLETQRTLLSTNYQNAIAQAIADGDLERASALYQEHIRVDEALVAQSQAQADENYRAWSASQSLTEDYRARQQERAEQLAAYGDFSGYRDLGYSEEQIQQMYTLWAAQNPTLAWYVNNGYGTGSTGSAGDYTDTTADSTETAQQSAYTPGQDSAVINDDAKWAWDTLDNMATGGESAADAYNVISQWEAQGIIGSGTASTMRSLYGSMLVGGDSSKKYA